jgi:ATP synthase I chain
MNPRSLKKTLVLIPTFALAILLIRQNYNWVFGMMIGAALALSSCELIQKAVGNSFVRKANRTVAFFLIGFFFRYILFALLLYVAVIYFKVNVIAIILSFTFVQLLYPLYLVSSLQRQNQNG